MSGLRCIVDGSTGPLVRRKIVVFRRLEPGDVRTPGSHQLPHSPYLEGKVVDVALSKSFHDDLVRVEAKRAEVLGTGDGSLLHRFDIPGVILAGAGATWIGSYLGYAPESFRPALAVAFGVGVVLALATRVLKARADAAATERWKTVPERKEHERLGRELAEAWIRFGSQVKSEHPGFHTEVRVGEGGTTPQRLCSIDPRGFVAIPPSFDSQDWLPTVGGGVRYEEIDVMGELVTRGLDAVDDYETEPQPAQAEKKAVTSSGEPVKDAAKGPDEGTEKGAEKKGTEKKGAAEDAGAGAAEG